MQAITRLWATLAVAGMLGLAGSAAAQDGGSPPPTPVTVVTLQAQNVTMTSDLPGRVVASGVAEVRPQVNGIIVERLFQEGSDVSQGQPLYRIDSASYEARVAAAEAQVAQAEAQLRAAERNSLGPENHPPPLTAGLPAPPLAMNPYSFVSPHCVS